MSKKTNGKIYYSFDEVAQEVFGMKPLKKQTNDKDRLKKQQEKYLGTCPFCKEPCAYVEGTNIVACVNPKCKGRKISTTNDDGSETVVYESYYRIKSCGAEVGTGLFDE